MFRGTRTVHRWIGITAAIFLIVISATGFFLAMKKRITWVQPPTQSGTPVTDLDQLLPPSEIAAAAFAEGVPDLENLEDIDRFEYQISDGIVKLTSVENYREVQIDATTGEVLLIAQRNDQLMEDLHDMSWFSEFLHAYWLPVVAVLLFLLGVTGVYIFFVPVVRRWRFRRTQGGKR